MPCVRGSWSRGCSCGPSAPSSISHAGIHHRGRGAFDQRGGLDVVSPSFGVDDDGTDVQNPTAVPCRSYASARSILTMTISPNPSGRRLSTWTAPSILGALRGRDLLPADPWLLVDDHLLPGADLACQASCRDCRGLHGSDAAALLLYLVDGGGEVVGGGARDRLIAEAADAIELRLGEPIEQELEIRLGLAREADDEVERMVRSDSIAPARDALQRVLACAAGGVPIRLSTPGSRAGTGCRDRAGPCRPPSAG